MDDPMSMITGIVKLPSIPLAVSSQPYQIYRDPETILGAYLLCTLAGVAETDANVDLDVLHVWVEDGQGVVLIDGLTPAQLRAVDDHLFTYNSALAANTGVIPLPLLPQDFELSLSQARYGLGRKGADGKAVEFKITIETSAGPLSMDACTPYIIVDPTERMAEVGPHYRIDIYQFTQAAIGEHEIENIFQGCNAVAVRELWFNVAVATLSVLTVRQGRANKLYQTPSAIIRQENRHARLTAVAGREIVSFGTRRDPSARLQLVGNDPVHIIPTWTVAPPGASDVIRVLEYYDRVPK